MAVHFSAVPQGSMVDPCCCVNCNDLFSSDLNVNIAGVLACLGVVMDVNGDFTAVYIGGSTWSVTVGTITDGVLSGNAVLFLLCDGATGGLFIAINCDGDFAGSSAFSSGPDPIPIGDPAANVNVCGSFVVGFGGTITVTTP